MSGWVKLHRQILDNPRSKDPNWVTVWVYLILNATFKEKKGILGRQVVTLVPGQIITGRDVIAESTGVHRSTVERILKTLEIEQQIEQQTSTKNRLITIKNWGKYQGDENGEQQFEQQTSNKRATNEHIQEREEEKNKERERVAAPRNRRVVGFEPSPEALLLFQAWKAHFPADDAPKVQTCKNLAARLRETPFQALLFSVLAYRAKVSKDAQLRPEGVMTYKGSNFFGEKAYYADYLPKPGQLDHPQVQSRLQAVLAVLAGVPESTIITHSQKETV